MYNLIAIFFARKALQKLSFKYNYFQVSLLIFLYIRIWIVEKEYVNGHILYAIIYENNYMNNFCPDKVVFSWVKWMFQTFLIKLSKVYKYKRFHKGIILKNH